MPKKPQSKSSQTRQELIAAATALIRQNGYTATTVDKICTAAGVTKGAFFHYFKSKEDLACAAVEAWCQWGARTYTGFQGSPTDDPLKRFNRLLDNMISMTTNPLYSPLICLLGMVAQETGGSETALAQACDAGLNVWNRMVAALLEEVRQTHSVDDLFIPDQIAWMLNSLWQGSMLTAKTHGDTVIVANNLRHFRAYINSFFVPEQRSEELTE